MLALGSSKPWGASKPWPEALEALTGRDADGRDGDPRLLRAAPSAWLELLSSRSAVAGLTARNAMITRYETIAPQESLGRAAEMLLSSHQQDFPVVDAWGRVAGLLPRGALLAALATPGGRERAVLEVMDREPQTVSVDMPLEAVLRHLQSRPLQPILVIGQEAGATGLVGMITLDNLGELIQISQTMKQA
jgi:predicted transcriptional regulator